MANQCFNCGRSLSLLEKGFKLQETKAVFCTSCGERIASVFANVPEDFFNVTESQEASFKRNISELGLSTRVKNYILLEYALMTDARSSSAAYVKFFPATFEDSYRLIQSAVNEVSGCNLEANIISVAGVKTSTFVFDSSSAFLNNDHSVLAVNLVHANGKAIVTTKGCNDVFGDYFKLHKKFWIALQNANPDIEISSIRTLHYDLAKVCSDASMEKDFRSGGKRIGILGGSFDPVHCGHVALGRAAMAEGNLQKLIVMPAHVQPFKRGREVAEDHHRLEMCRLAFSKSEHTEVSDYELTHTEISYTYDTLVWLQSAYPDSRLYFITGTDAFLDIEYWRKGRDLLEYYGFIVSVRPGYKDRSWKIKFCTIVNDTAVK